MSIFLRHKASAIVLLAYILWWLFLGYSFWKAIQSQVSCVTSFVAVFFLTAVIGAVLSVAFAVKYLISKSSTKKDYLIFLTIVILPALLLFFAFYVG